MRNADEAASYAVLGAARKRRGDGEPVAILEPERPGSVLVAQSGEHRQWLGEG